MLSVQVYSDRMVEHSAMVLASFSPDADPRTKGRRDKSACNTRMPTYARAWTQGPWSPQQRIGMHDRTPSKACSVRILILVRRGSLRNGKVAPASVGSLHLHETREETFRHLESHEEEINRALGTRQNQDSTLLPESSVVASCDRHTKSL